MKKYNITVFGDSIAKGLLIKKGRPSYLPVNAVDLISKHFDVEICNKSSFGQTITRLTEKGLVDEYLKKISRRDKNIVVFCIGGNDSDFDWKAIGEHPEKMHTSKTSLADFYKLYSEAIAKLKKKKVEVYVCALPVVCAKKFFKNYVCSLAPCDQVMKFLNNDISIIARYQEIFNNQLREIARETNTTFLDIRTPFLNVRNLEKLYSEDGLHPNEDGQRLIADTVINHFQKKFKATI